MSTADLNWIPLPDPLGDLERALREEVDQLCDEAGNIDDKIGFEVNHRLRETLLRIADRIRESA